MKSCEYSKYQLATMVCPCYRMSGRRATRATRRTSIRSSALPARSRRNTRNFGFRRVVWLGRVIGVEIATRLSGTCSERNWSSVNSALANAYTPQSLGAEMAVMSPKYRLYSHQPPTMLAARFASAGLPNLGPPIRKTKFPTACNRDARCV